MSEYTVEIVASNANGLTWQAMAPAETVTAESAAEAARITAQNQNIAEGDNWMVRAWDGADADTSTYPAAQYDPSAPPTDES
jgi:hypothetical protein